MLAKAYLMLTNRKPTLHATSSSNIPLQHHSPRTFTPTFCYHLPKKHTPKQVTEKHFAKMSNKSSWDALPPKSTTHTHAGEGLPDADKSKPTLHATSSSNIPFQHHSLRTFTPTFCYHLPKSSYRKALC